MIVSSGTMSTEEMFGGTIPGKVPKMDVEDHSRMNRIVQFREWETKNNTVET